MFTLNCNGKLWPADKPLVMGILNITPDSFYPGSRFMDDESILRQGEKMIADGADILDIGGQSTRPGAEEIGVEEELQRVIPAITLLHRHFPGTVISVDTWYSRVAREAVAAGAAMVNDISGGSLDPRMLDTVGGLHVPYVCMHMKGTPATMNGEAVYDNVTKEVLDFFIGRIAACRAAGIHDLILDPGLGFAKKAHHNFELLKNLAIFRMTGCPILLGASRKSFIYRSLGIGSAEALNGTTVTNTLALLNGADILRVHDPLEARQAVLLLERYKSTNAH
ncbi:MAG TPA: dihydropteroate synthase [Puia sp.]|nr:dihydropteroate synthase [Puia sp.]